MKTFNLYLRIIFLQGLFITLSVSGFSQSTHRYTLTQCIDSVQEKSYLLQSDFYRTKAAESSVLSAHARTLPWISGEAGLESRFLRPYNFGQQWATIHGEWNPGDYFLKTEAPAQQAVITARYQQEKTRLDAIGRVSTLYMGIIQKQTERSLLNQQLSLLMQHKSLTESLWKAGQRTEIDILRTETEISGVNEQINLTLTEEIRLRVELKRLLGIPLSDTLETEGINTGSIVESTSVPPADSTLLSGNPMLMILSSEIEGTQLSKKLISAQQWPSLFMSSGYFRDRDPTGDGNYWLINAGISVPVFRFGSTKYQLQQVEAEIDALDYRLYDAYRELSIHQQQVVEHMRQLTHLLSIQQQRLEFSQKALALAATNYKAGLITNLEYLTLYQQVTGTRIHIEEVRLEYIMYLVEYYLVNNEVDKIRFLQNYTTGKN